MKRWISPLMLGLVITPVMAADQHGKFAVEGAGLGSCDNFLTAMEQKNNHYYVYGGWLEGYISGHNRLSANTYDLTPWQQTGLILSMAASICQAKKTWRFQQAADVLLAEFGKHSLDQGSPLVNIGSKESPLFLRKGAIRLIQQQLAERGFYTDKVDGEFGAASRRALQAFQQSINRQPDGVPDQGTLFELFKP